MDNEKLKGIAEKCITDDQFAVGLFASILIDECLLAIDNTAKPHVHTSFDKNQHESAIIEAKNAIKNHFGIK